MKYFGDGLSDVHKALNKIIRKEDEIERAKSLFLDLHRELHLSEVSEGEENEVDRLLNQCYRAASLQERGRNQNQEYS
jgi:hypothetical protein